MLWKYCVDATYVRTYVAQRSCKVNAHATWELRLYHAHLLRINWNKRKHFCVDGWKMRSKMAFCRLFVALVLGGLTLLVVNMLLLWNQASSQQCPLCDCSGHQSQSSLSDVRRVVELPSLEASQESKRTPEAVNQRTNNLIRLLSKSRQQQQHQGGAESLHQLAVIVPFRNRYEEMMEFVPHIHNFLERQNVKHKIWIINQADAHRCVRRI